MTLGLPSWSFKFPWLFNWHDSSNSCVRPLDFHFTSHLVTMDMAHSGDVAKTTHDTTQHENTNMYLPTMVFMSSCCTIEWWMYSWCSLSSPSHGLVLQGLRWSWPCMTVQCKCSFLLLLHMFGTSVQLQIYVLGSLYSLLKTFYDDLLKKNIWKGFSLVGFFPGLGPIYCLLWLWCCLLCNTIYCSNFSYS